MEKLFVQSQIGCECDSYSETGVKDLQSLRLLFKTGESGMERDGKRWREMFTDDAEQAGGR